MPEDDFHDEYVNHKNHIGLALDTLSLVNKGTLDITDQAEGLEKQSDLPAHVKVRQLELTGLHRAGYLLDASNDLSNNLDAIKALHWAAKSGYFWELKYLLDRGVNPCAIDNEEHSRKRVALHYAAGGGFTKEVDVLIEKGADVMALDSKSWSPLHCAARGGFRTISEALLKAGASVHSLTSFLETPLHCAARHGHNDVFQLLLDWRADGSAKDMERYTPFKRARQTKSKALRNPELKEGQSDSMGKGSKGLWGSIFEGKSGTKALRN